MTTGREEEKHERIKDLLKPGLPAAASSQPAKKQFKEHMETSYECIHIYCTFDSSCSIYLEM